LERVDNHLDLWYEYLNHMITTITDVENLTKNY